jgi:hypothetical protein
MYNLITSVIVNLFLIYIIIQERKENKVLLDRVMAKDYKEFKQLEVKPDKPKVAIEPKQKEVKRFV